MVMFNMDKFESNLILACDTNKLINNHGGSL